MKRTLLAMLITVSAPAAAHEAPGGLVAMLIEHDCRNLLLTYGEGLDTVDPAKIWPLFTPDAVWTADGAITLEGRDAIRKTWEGIAANPRPTVGRHAINNIRFTPFDADTASGTALVTQHRYNPDKRDEIETLGAMMLVEIDMRCVRTDEGWRFARMALKSVSTAGYRHGED